MCDNEGGDGRDRRHVGVELAGVVQPGREWRLLNQRKAGVIMLGTSYRIVGAAEHYVRLSVSLVAGQKGWSLVLWC